MSHAYKGHVALGQQGVEVPLGGHIQGTGGLIKHHKPGGIQQQPGEGQALLLAQGQQPGPVLNDVEIGIALHQVGQPHLLEHVAQLVIAEPIRLQGVTELFPQAAQQHVGLLGDEQQLPFAGPLHPAGRRRPQPAHHAQEGGFAATGGPHHQQALVAIHFEAQITDQSAVGARRHQIHVAHQDRAVVATAAGGGELHRQGCCFRADGIHLALEALQTADRSGERGQSIDVVDDVAD